MMPHNSDRVNYDPQLCSAYNLSQKVVGDQTASIVDSGVQKILSTENSAPIKNGREVSKKEPCSCCGKTDWCFLLDDGNATVCGRTDIPPTGWKRVGTAKDSRAIFAKNNSRHTQQSRGDSYTVNRKCLPSPSLDRLRLMPRVKEDFPIWTAVGQPTDGAVERQIIFSYPDPSTGKPLGRVVRRQWSDRRPAYNSDRTKFICPERWVDSSNPKEGKWMIGKDNQPWPLYREAEVREAIARGEAVIFYGGGEQDVESFRKLGLTAFCNQGGEGARITQIESFLKTHQPQLFVIWPDHDDVGEKTKIKLLKASKAAGVPVVAIDPLQIWADIPFKGDITNVLEDSGMEVSEIIRRLETEIHRALSQRQETVVLEQERQKLPAASAIALELADQYRQQLAFDARASHFLRYEAELPGVWSELLDVEVQNMIQAELDSRLETRSKYGISYVKSILELLKGYIQVKNWNEPKDLLPFHNGVLNLKTHEFLSHAPSHRFRWSLPRNHDPNATDWSQISEWMDQATGGDASVKSVLCCWLNACMKGRSDLQRFLHLIGPGGSGKGTFIHLCVALVGSMNTHSSTLVDCCENRFEIFNAYGKRLVAFWDQDKYRGGLGRFKSLTGGDFLRGEGKNEQKPLQFVYGGMVILSSNFPIFTGDGSSGITRRALVIPFNQSVAPSKRRNLSAEFEPELAALTNYVLSIPDKVVTQTLLQTVKPSSKVLKQTWENQIQENPIAAWLNECVVLDPDAKTQIGSNKNRAETLFGSYWQYCEHIGMRPLSGCQFTPALLDLCQNALNLPVHKGRNNQFHYFAGLRLRTPCDAQWIVSRCDELCEGDGAMLGEHDGANPLANLNCAECDDLTPYLQDEELDQISDRTSPSDKFNKLSVDSTLSITPGNSIQDRCFSCDESSRVMERAPNTLPNSELKVIEVGSQVRKRHKQGWRGTVCSIQGECVGVKWHLEKYPEQISLAELELLKSE